MIPKLLFDINPNYNITPDITNISNITTDIFWKAFQPFIQVVGYNVFWTFIFIIIGFGLAYMTRFNMTIIFSYLIAVDILFAYAMLPLALLIFGVITSLFATVIIYRSFVSKR